jgi:hypothetical protein
MPIDLVNVNWLYVILLGVFVFVAAFLGNLLSFHHRGTAALISAALFVVIFIFWTYYPHGVPFLPTRLTAERPVTAEPAGMPNQAPSPEKPRNPVTDITPPKNPVTDVTPPKNPVTDITPPANPPAGNSQ